MGPGGRAVRRRDRPDLRPRRARRLRAVRDRSTTRRFHRTQPGLYEDRARRSWPTTSARSSRSGGRGGGLRLRQQPPGPGPGGGRRGAFDYPGFVPAFIRPQFCETRPVPVVRAWAPRGHRPHRSRGPRAVSRLTPPPPRWIQMAQARVRFRASPRASAGSAMANARSRPRVQPSSPGRAPGADRHRARSPDAGSVASPNRETEAMADGSMRSRTGRCSTPSSTPPPARRRSRSTRRRRGHRVQPARRHVVPRRRHRAGGAQARAGAHDGPGHGRRAPRGRGLQRAIDVARERGIRIPMRDPADAPSTRGGPAGAAGGASSSTGSGIVTISRTDDRATGRNASSPPIAPTQIVAWRPMMSPRRRRRSRPVVPTRWPHRRVHPPCIRGGVTPVAADLVDVPAIAKKPPRKPDRASAKRYDDDAIATGRPDTLNPMAARPASARRRRGPSGAP